MANVDESVSEEFKDEMKEWFHKDNVLKQLKERESISKDFYSYAAGEWFKAIFMVSDYDENGEISHIIYGCQNINDTKKIEIENQKEILDKYKLLKSVAEIYYTLHEIDLINNITISYNAPQIVEEIVNSVDGIEQKIRNVIVETVQPEYLNSALEFTDLSTISKRMQNKKIITAEFVGKNIGWFTASFITVESDEEGKATKIVLATRCIDDIKRKEEKLIITSNTDELTGAYNRCAYEEEIAELEKNGIKNDFVYISVDVNGLKIINDSIGHNAGDELIVGASSCLIRTVGQYGKVFRTGGDEFIVLANISNNQLNNVLETLDLTVESWYGTLVDNLSLSYGFVTREENQNMTIQEIAILADKRMYESKSLHYYRNKGINRRGQRDAHIALCSLYTKILKINLTDDTYEIINMDESEKDIEYGFNEKISVWLKSFGENGLVHKDDLEEYMSKTDIKYLEEYFLNGKTSLQLFYRRKIDDEFK